MENGYLSVETECFLRNFYIEASCEDVQAAELSTSGRTQVARLLKYSRQGVEKYWKTKSAASHPTQTQKNLPTDSGR